MDNWNHLDELNKAIFDASVSIDWSSDPKDGLQKSVAIAKLEDAKAKEREMAVEKHKADTERIKVFGFLGLGIATVLIQLIVGTRATQKEKAGELMMGQERNIASECTKGLFRPFRMF